MDKRILALLAVEDLSAAELAQRLQCKQTAVYQSLVHLEGEGLAEVWVRVDPRRAVWSRVHE